MINHLITQKNWQTQLSTVITSVDELLSLLNLESLRTQIYIPAHFELRVPRAFVGKMKKGDANDPLLQQVLPNKQEQLAVTGYVADPLAENEQNPIQGLLHKYQSRVLLTVTGACAIHCRYCFRQHFDYSANMPKSEAKDNIKAYIAQHPEINEVILSGGDPLSVSNRRLFAWLDILESMSQLTTIRLHTRLPLVIPERLDNEMLERLAQSRCQIVMVVHCNHANEIDSNTAEYLQRARSAGITLLNQTVLLEGINDDVATQVALSQRLFAAGVLPYYLHVLDKVAGAAHFDKEEAAAVQLYWRLLAELPGYLVPKLVRELPNRPFKVPIDIYKQV
ncbi:EF-P beta-lysylation protein EpmB [Psychrobacter jeotgali]|uniref:EF-P beta-lysylation protein EpmB n=1 Tax=Psychrobacter jeotgali TaxID=179010 RepID=UPI001919536B|nr:EF-P beta-lysylation protein EpmB [Psychrobacter jeotgali]